MNPWSGKPKYTLWLMKSEIKTVGALRWSCKEWDSPRSGMLLHSSFTEGWEWSACCFVERGRPRCDRGKGEDSIWMKELLCKDPVFSLLCSRITVWHWGNGNNMRETLHLFLLRSFWFMRLTYSYNTSAQAYSLRNIHRLMWCTKCA